MERISIEDRGHDTPCWIFTGMLDPRGYGRIQAGSALDGTRGPVLAHHVAFGVLPERLELDHLCCVPACVNPEHLEAVTHAENMQRYYQRDGRGATRAAAGRTHCKNGHPWSPENTRISEGRRKCRACAREAAVAGRTHCKNGHEYTSENTTFGLGGRRICTTCRAPNVGH